MKLLLVSLALTLLFPTNLQRDAPAGVTVLIQNSADPMRHGSGVIVGRDRSGNLLILTARHIAVEPNMRVVFPDGTSAPVLRRYVQPRTAVAWAGDVAVIVARNERQTAIAHLAHDDAANGDILAVVGNPADLRFHTNFASAAGTVSVRWLDDAEEHVIDANTSMDERKGRVFRSLEVACRGCAPGDSGAGVYNASGRLVGIMYGARYADDDQRFMLEALTGRYAGEIPSTSFVVPISEIRPLLAAARRLRLVSVP